ncbi:MAG: glycosyl hydrolase 53 family protein [Polyangiaceae bacterium]
MSQLPTSRMRYRRSHVPMLLFVALLPLSGCGDAREDHGSSGGSGGTSEDTTNRGGKSAVGTSTASTGGSSSKGGQGGSMGTIDTDPLGGTTAQSSLGGTAGQGGAAGQGGLGLGGTTTSTSKGGATTGGSSGGAGGATGSGGTSVAGGTTSAPPQRPDFIMGADLSSVQEAVDLGAKFVDTDGQEKDVATLFAAHGFNYVRLRTFVGPTNLYGYANPTGEAAYVRAEAYCDRDHTAEFGKQFKDAGFKLFVDLHYSDIWADPRKQIIPQNWRDASTIEDLAQRVKTYSQDVVQKLVDSGARPDFVQVGNEITPGMLIHVPAQNPNPDQWGNMNQDINSINGSTANWANLATLLKAGIEGVHAVDSDDSRRSPSREHEVRAGGDQLGRVCTEPGRKVRCPRIVLLRRLAGSTRRLGKHLPRSSAGLPAAFVHRRRVWPRGASCSRNHARFTE